MPEPPAILTDALPLPDPHVSEIDVELRLSVLTVGVRVKDCIVLQ